MDVASVTSPIGFVESFLCLKYGGLNSAMLDWPAENPPTGLEAACLCAAPDLQLNVSAP